MTLNIATAHSCRVLSSLYSLISVLLEAQPLITIITADRGIQVSSFKLECHAGQVI